MFTQKLFYRDLKRKFRQRNYIKVEINNILTRQIECNVVDVLIKNREKIVELLTNIDRDRDTSKTEK